jgi:predicted TIM-barrel fold metal-dependent hydrolase
MALNFIDADSHVYEVDETWNYLPKKFQSRKPLTITIPRKDAPYMGVDNSFWLIDGKAIQWTWGRGTVQVGCPLTSEHALRKAYGTGHQSLMDVPMRLKAMDNAGIDVQVIYPTLFLVPLTDDDDFETALTVSYNTWIAERCALSPRLKWVAMLPMRQPEAAVKEIERCKKLGAVGAVTFGTVGDKMLHWPEFDRVWGAAADHDLPVAVHVGWSHPGLRNLCDDHGSSLNISFTLPLLIGMFSFIGGGILDRHPKLRSVFLEGGAGFIPWFYERCDHYHPVAHFFRSSFGLPPQPKESPEAYKDRVFATCEADEALLPQVIEYLGEDNVMAAEDMPHLEAREGGGAEIRGRDDITEVQKQKILVDNTARFYKLDVNSLVERQAAE